jgi:uncharacterized DUF497 family protein
MYVGILMFLFVKSIYFTVYTVWYIFKELVMGITIISEDRYFGVGDLNGVLIVLIFFTLKEGRTRIISARKAELEVQEAYYEQLKNFQ